RLADPAEGDAGERDAELRGGDGPVQVGDRTLDGRGRADALADHLLDPGLAHGDEGELGGDEEAVERYQGGDREESEGVPGPVRCLFGGEQREHDRLPPGSGPGCASPVTLPGVNGQGKDRCSPSRGGSRGHFTAAGPGRGNRCPYPFGSLN